MIFHNRPLARLGAAALLASGAFTALGVPAYAAGTGTDLSLDVAGTRIAANVEGKAAFVKISNKGENTPSKAQVIIDIAKLDPAKAGVLPFADECEPGTASTWVCTLTEREIPAPGATVELPLVIFKDTVQGAYSAPVTFTVQSPEDTDPTNDSKTVQVEFTEESGVDLSVLAPDVDRRIKPEDWDTDPAKAPLLKPGEETIAQAFIFNQGDMIADGLDLKVTLPKGVTFSWDLKECEFSADRRTADCQAGLLKLKPGEDLWGVFPVKVAADVKAPVSLTGGMVTVSARGELPANEKTLAATGSTLPSFLKEAAAGAKATDIDESDNSDNFAVIVAAKPNGGGGGTGGDNGNGGGGLPVTGPQAGLIGGVGVAAAIAGGVLFLAARRRRVVLVTPGDEKPTA
ncbi:cell wall anchor protein [Micromonospora sp. CPCC 205711]|uniref:cell wall anchor protein n=1 Tax=Micromonospora sp. CPCC 205547 TaxID=3122400 RepID=UPI002FF34963